MGEKRTKPMLTGDLLSWDLDADRNVVDQADYEAWCHATTHWSFGDGFANELGDELLIREWHPVTHQYSGRAVRRTISHMLRNFRGIQSGYVVISFAPSGGTDAPSRAP